MREHHGLHIAKYRRQYGVAVLYGVVGAVTLYFVGSYLAGSGLQTYDAAGHLLTVQMLMESWPQFYVWLPDQLLGLHYAVQYPPLIHWLMAGLGLVVGAALAMKLIVSLALLALPWTLYYYGRVVGMEPIVRAIFVMVAMVVLTVTPAYFGGNISGLVQLGLVTSFVAVPMVILTWALTERIARQTEQRWLWVLALGTVMGLLVWSHLIGALVAGLYLAAALAVALVQRRYHLVGDYVVAGSVACVIAAPFIYNFVTHYGQTIGVASGIVSSTTAIIGSGFVAVMVGVALVRYRPSVMRWTPLIVVLVLCFVGLLDIVLARRDPTTSLLYAVNAYRFQPFMLLLLLVVVMQLLRSGISLVSRRTIGVAIVGSVMLSMMVLAIKNPFALATETIVYDQRQIDGRFIEAFTRQESGNRPYTLQTAIVSHNESAAWAYGLFIESEPNAAFLKSLSISLNPNYHDDSVPQFVPEQVVVAPERREQLLDLFGISHVITMSDTAEGSLGSYTSSSGVRYFHDTVRRGVDRAEVSEYQLLPVETGFEATVLEWWQQDGPLRTLPYDARHGRLSTTATAANVTVLRWDSTGIELTIDSEVPTPVIVKASYSPDWSGMMDDGSAVPIYRAAPNLMLIEAHGHVTLRP